ncbi:hypothetical protein DXG01_000165 [Tephrocybe rancida]|nr:hypothetical protein DXG01_000165 [Tephrocybe rancida]
MVWPVTLQRTVLLKQTIHAPPEAVLTLLHDPDVLFSTSPLITNVSPDSPQASNSSYTVTDTISFAGLFNFKTKYKCWLDLLEDGVNTKVAAGFGTTLKGQYRVKAVLEGEATELSDEAVVESVFFMLPYILSTFTAAHKSALEVLAAKAENRSSRPPVNHLDTSFPHLWATVTTLVVIVYYVLPKLHIPSYMIIAAALVLLYWFNTASDPYGLSHLSLNKLPGDNADSPPRTEWLNMGFWKDTDIFPEACEGEMGSQQNAFRANSHVALCVKLIDAARCQNGDHILDVGHGTGESLMLLLSGTSSPRPSNVTGITSLPVHHHRSQDRVNVLLSSLPRPRPEVDLHLGDAVCQRAQADHPLDASSPKLFDRILALDCAYHFNTRCDFLRQAYPKLAPGGRIALADICFDARMLQSRRLWFLASVVRLLPAHNIVSGEDYVSQMKEMGYVDVELEDISAYVFPGFVRFLKARGLGWSWLPSKVIEGLLQSMTAIQAVYIRGWEERSAPKPHTVYRIEIQAHVRSWQMWRRYSEFDDLHTEISKAVGSPPPASLPPKHKFSFIRARTDEKLLEERRSGLEGYLRAILSAKEDQWRESFAFKDFLGVPVSRQGGGPPTQFTSATWLDEHIELQTRIRAVRADINKRDALSDRGDVGGSHKANVTAKAKLAGLSPRISTLEKGLEELALSGISEGELQRRTDMVARLRDDHEKLTRMVTVARQTSRPSAGTSSMPVPETDREALLGVNVFKPVTRVFGAQPKETEQTRPLDDHGIFGLQQVQMQQQDQELSQLSTILHRQKQLGIAIGNEIVSQNEVLDDLLNEVDRVGGKLTTTNRQLNRLG